MTIIAIAVTPPAPAPKGTVVLPLPATVEGLSVPLPLQPVQKVREYIFVSAVYSLHFYR
jgi:hypothetical protein